MTAKQFCLRYNRLLWLLQLPSPSAQPLPNSNMHAHACARAHTRSHTHTHTRTHTRTHSHMHARTHARTHAHTHTHTHTHIDPLSSNDSLIIVCPKLQRGVSGNARTTTKLLSLVYSCTNGTDPTATSGTNTPLPSCASSAVLHPISSSHPPCRPNA